MYRLQKNHNGISINIRMNLGIKIGVNNKAQHITSYQRDNPQMMDGSAPQHGVKTWRYTILASSL